MRKSGAPNTDGASKSKQQLSMGSGLNVLTSLPPACSLSLGKYSEEALCTQSSCPFYLLGQSPAHARLFVLPPFMPQPPH